MKEDVMLPDAHIAFGVGVLPIVGHCENHFHTMVGSCVKNVV